MTETTPTRTVLAKGEKPDIVTLFPENYDRDENFLVDVRVAKFTYDDCYYGLVTMEDIQKGQHVITTTGDDLTIDQWVAKLDDADADDGYYFCVKLLCIDFVTDVVSAIDSFY
eukprot:TRINITY_DN2065_c0_g3_i2.p1 TRINITY_DN2065_c0_g3~~TRINITY_DN2065_c0_g3_i2.p1  ORF type:complete len:113 (-),score=32.51 TRINITY_DN2065_c0_g3_i2:115-453(-)